jgi:two-component system, sensor histidine kinase LadS
MGFLNNMLQSKTKLFFLLFSFLTVSTFAQQALMLNEKSQKYTVEKELYIYQTTLNESFDEIIKRENQSKFIQNSEGVPNLGFTDGNYWIRLTIKNNLARKKVFLEFTYPFYNELDFYVSDLTGKYTKTKVGDHQAFSKRPVYHKNFQFELDFYPLEEKVIYAYLPCDGEATSIPVNIFTAKGLSQRDNDQQLAFGLYFGIMLFALFLALFLGVTLKEKSYWYYVLYIVSVAIFQFSLEGYAFQYLWSNNTWLANHIIPIAGACSIFFLMLFSKELLNTKENSKILNKILNGVSLIVVFLFVLSFLPQYASAIKYLNFVALLGNILVFVSAIVAYKKGYKPARYFLIAFSLLLLGIVLALLKNFGVLPRNFITEYAINIGSAIEIILLAFALSEKVKTLREEKEAAQALLLEELQEKNRIQERANQELEIKVTERTKEINAQKHVIEEKNKEITDSINYAKRIQHAILPSDEELKEYFTESFVLYQPKDIVSGDFYWSISTTTNDKKKVSVISAIDCTGHGVPGAFMSIMGYTILNQTKQQQGVNCPADVLNFLNSQLSDVLKQRKTENTIRDGMDMSICAVDYSSNQIQFAGANNPIYLIRNKELIEYKADKQPIGAYIDERVTPFTNHTIATQKGDCLYLFTDGYADQFGGPKGKKFKNQQFKELLIEVSALPMETQKQTLKNKINDWKGSLEQVDDILVIGIRI